MGAVELLVASTLEMIASTLEMNLFVAPPKDVAAALCLAWLKVCSWCLSAPGICRVLGSIPSGCQIP